MTIVGANNSGKSNILRALNLFFNDETEPGRFINLYEDFHNPSRRKKKQIRINLEFHLPSRFNFQKTIRSSLEALLGRNFLIEKRWSLPDYPVERGAKLEIYYKKDNGSLVLADREAEYRIRQFLALIRFRFLPNHIHPSELLRNEQNSIQTELLAKLKRSRGITPESQKMIFVELERLSKEFIEPIAKILQTAASDIEDIDLSTPTGMGELLFSFAPRMKVTGGETLNALLHGSGVQSLLTFLILHYLDSRFSSRFGWHQASIWAIEEPESFLHKDLEHRVAGFLSNEGTLSSSRFQFFCTTHSDVFIRHASDGLICNLENGKTDTKVRAARTLVEEAAQQGISSYIPSLIFGAPKPLLIVEGPSDKILVEYSYATLGIACPWEIQDIDTITAGEFTGVDGLKPYLKANKGILGSRPLKAPVFILLDWNVADGKLRDIQRLLGVHSTSHAVRWIS
jgi:predicted ATP-dependent endonuclease of OLD family